MLETGTYYPNIPGARTLADARPLYAGTERVSIVIDEATATLFFGGRIVATRARGDFASHADLVGWASGLVAEETVDGFAVEEVPVTDLRAEDQVVIAVSGRPAFTPVTTRPFRLERYDGRTGQVVQTGQVGLSLCGTRKVVPAGRTFKRAKDPHAVEDVAQARRRELFRGLRKIAKT